MLVLAGTKLVARLPASDFPSENPRPQTRNFPYTNTLAIIMKNTILIIILTFTIGMKAQDLTKSDFKKTEWFADNENRNFYESDKITLTRILKFNNENEKLNKTYIKLQQNQNGNITELNFKNSGELFVEDLNVENWSNSKLIGKWKWKFDSRNQVLNLYFKRKLYSAFRIESKKKDSIIWKFEHNNKATESKLNLLVLNLIRLKK
ncbi:hypothetical protein [Confluentibacter citreus]|uniref:hypothetical protein n=1 Tax=Confluentibacter citreus TaxID=2007307 RepID=UPI0012FE0C9B|nr:hypothetical protein [Confluentibacter citreus]